MKEADAVKLLCPFVGLVVVGSGNNQTIIAGNGQAFSEVTQLAAGQAAAPVFPTCIASKCMAWVSRKPGTGLCGLMTLNPQGLEQP